MNKRIGIFLLIRALIACGNMRTADSQTQKTEIIDSAKDTESSEKERSNEGYFVLHRSLQFTSIVVCITYW